MCRLTLFCFLLLFTAELLPAQKPVQRDTLSVYEVIARADQLAAVGRIDAAIQMNSTAVQESRKMKFERGEGYALLKAAELFFKQ
jgi:hypothetical protein